VISIAPPAPVPAKLRVAVTPSSWQLAEHPSPPSALPSSQVSPQVAAARPFPQTDRVEAEARWFNRLRRPRDRSGAPARLIKRVDTKPSRETATEHFAGLG
jgi:hypothetical protein